jgi:hypothetical protein
VFSGKKTHRDNTVQDDILEKIRQYIITGNLCFKNNVVDCSIVLLVLHQAQSLHVLYIQEYDNSLRMFK